MTICPAFSITSRSAAKIVYKKINEIVIKMNKRFKYFINIMNGYDYYKNDKFYAQKL